MFIKSFQSFNRKFSSIFKPHPFRMLLYLEWLLLSISLINPLFFITVVDIPSEQSTFLTYVSQLPWLFWGYAIAFGVMGLRLPAKDISVKIIYTAIEFIVVIFASYFLYWEPIYSALILLIFAIRSCLIFSRIGQLLIATIIFIFFTLNVFIPNWFLNEEVSIVYYTEEFPSQTSVIDPEDFQDLPAQELFSENPQQIDSEVFKTRLQNIILFALVLVFVYLLINTLVAERQSRRKLAHAHAKLYEYATKIENQATLQERNRIAREIHDSLGHLLTAQSIQLANGLLAMQSDQKQAETFFQTSKQITSKALKELRQSVHSLRASPVREEFLEVAITNLVENYQQITGIAIATTIDLHLPVSPQISNAVFRIVEEALTNIYKHSGATKVKIFLQTELSSSNPPLLWFKIEDNGRGFYVEDNMIGFGLDSMEGRVVDLGGQFKIVSEPEKGCQILGNFSLRGVKR